MTRYLFRRRIRSSHRNDDHWLLTLATVYLPRYLCGFLALPSKPKV